MKRSVKAEREGIGGRRSPRWDWSRRRCAGPSVPSRLGRAGPVRVGPGPENIVVRSPESEPDMPVGWARDRRGSEIKPGPVQAEFCFARETRAPPRPAHRRRDSSLLYSCLLGYGHGDSLARWRRLSVTGKRASGLQLQGAGCCSMAIMTVVSTMSKNIVTVKPDFESDEWDVSGWTRD